MKPLYPISDFPDYDSTAFLNWGLIRESETGA